MTAADTLRQAADRLDTIAGAADPSGDWYTADALTELGLPVEDAELIALMTPKVALLLAYDQREHAKLQDWLTRWGARGLGDTHSAVRLARAILGEL